MYQDNIPTNTKVMNSLSHRYAAGREVWSELSMCATTATSTYLDTWILGVASNQLRLLHGLVGDSTIVVNSLSPQMSELVDDAIASWCGDIVGNFWLIRNGVEKLLKLKFEFFSFNTFDVSDISATSCTTEAQIQLLHSLEGIVLSFCLLDTE